MLDPRRLLTFREVARLGSFSRAAEELSLTQPAVSQQILSLERQIGIRLIDRGPGGVGLTAPGELLLRHADAVAGRLRLANEQLGAFVAEERRHLSIGAFPSAIATIEHEDLERLDLFEEPMVGALPPRHPLARRRRIDLERLANDPWTAPSRDGLIHRTCAAAGFEPNIAFVTHDVLAIRELVASGFAVTLTSRLLAGRLDGIATPAVTGDPARRSIYAVRPDTDSHPLTDRVLAELARRG